MTVRSLLLGLALGLFISCFTFFNDHVIGQTFFTGNHLPAAVFGVMLVMLLALNPLLRAMGAGLPLRPGELAIIVAMGLAVCAWPGSNLYRIFTHLMAVPAHSQQTRPAWHAAEVFSYVPGGSPRLGEGHVVDFRALAQRLHEPGEDEPVLAALWDQFRAGERRAVRGLAGETRHEARWEPVLRAINRAIDDETFHTAWAGDRLPPPAQAALREADALTERAARLHERSEALLAAAGNAEDDARPAALAGRAEALEAQALRQHRVVNRHLLVAALPDLLKPPPAGAGVLLNGGMYTPFATEVLMLGWQGPGTLGVLDLPWQTWWPTLRLWLGVSLLLALASLCLALIVHPQWARRELLPYPTVRFVEEVTATRPGAWMPAVVTSRLFWFGFGVVAVWHGLNGLHEWFPLVPQIDRRFDFSPIRELFPNISRADGSHYLFHPTIYFSVIGFGFFIQTRVALSLGLSLVCWTVLGGALIASGVGMNNDRFAVGANGTAVRFGAYVGLTLMILYFGRWYYLNVLTSAIGLPRNRETPTYAVWAARGMGLCIAAATFLLVRYGGLSPVLALLLVGVFLMVLLVLARVNVETGLFYAQPDWIPGVLLAGFFGLSGLGPEALLVLVVASLVLAADPREAIMPYLSNGLRLGESVGQARPGRLGWTLAGMVVLGLIVAGLVTFQFQHHEGLTADGWARALPENTLDRTSAAITELSARGELVESTGLGGLDHLRAMRPDMTVVGWSLLGLVLVTACAGARLRLSWWPIHPVLFVVWGTYPANNFAASFLLAAAVKGAVIKLGGERTHHSLKPLMVGLIAAELMMIVVWSTVGTVYYLNTEARPEVYRILPG